MNVVVSPAAEVDIDRAASWYEAQRPGLGEQFLDRVTEALERIEANPQGYAQVYRDLRRVVLRQFADYALWFRIRSDNSLVVACLSGRRDMRLVKERAAGVIEIPKPPEPS